MAIIQVTIVFGSGARIGPDGATLLESIRATGSISAAARRVGMPYKKAWTLLDVMSQAFTQPVVIASQGGTGGGGATLTPFGAEILERYQRITLEAAKIAEDDIKALARRVQRSTEPNV